MKLTIYKKQIVVLALALFVLLGYNFIKAYDESFWFPPAGNPPTRNVAAPINHGTSTYSTQPGSGNLGFDQLTAFEKVNSEQYCDLQGENCFAPGSTDTNEGNEMRYFKTSKVLISSSLLRVPGSVDGVFDFVGAGFPPNTVRVYLGFDRTKYGSYAQPTAYVFDAISNLVNKQLIGGSAVVDIVPANGLVGEWHTIRDGKIGYSVDCHDSSCGGSLHNSAVLRLLGLECSGQCADPLEGGTNGMGRSCIVKFTSRQMWHWVERSRRIYGEANDVFGITYGYRDNDQGNITPYLPHTEEIGHLWWDASTGSHSNRGYSWYSNVEHYAANKTYLQSKVTTNTSDQYAVLEVPLVVGSEYVIANGGYDGVWLATKAVVTSCTE